METKKQTIKQKIVATTVVLFMLFMLFGSLDLPNVSAVGTTTNLIQNVLAGSLGHSAMQNLVFSDITIGVPSNTTANLSPTNAWDYRGTGVGWGVTGYANALSVAGAGVNNIANSLIQWNPTGGAIVAINGVITSMTKGVVANLDGSRALFTAPGGSGMGNYQMLNVMVNVSYNGVISQLQGTYHAVLTMTSA